MKQPLSRHTAFSLIQQSHQRRENSEPQMKELSQYLEDMCDFDAHEVNGRSYYPFAQKTGRIHGHDTVAQSLQLIGTINRGPPSILRVETN